MSDFERVMAVAILLLAGLFVITFQEGFFISPQENQVTYISYPSPPETENKSVIKIFEVGINEKIKHITIAENVIISFTADEKIALSESNITVKNGFGGRKAYENTFYIFWPEMVEKAKIEIEVHDTNLYGNLLVFLNNELIYENLTRRGKVVIDLNVSKLKERNEIMIFATSSGWRLWAPTTYILSFNVTLYFFDLKKKELPFNIGDEIKTLRLLRLLWTVEKIEGEGNLIVKFNGKEIYRGREKAPMIDLEPEKIEIKKGVNLLEFYTEKNTSFYIEKVNAVLFYREKESPVFTFNISEDEYNMLLKKNATLSFIIQKIYGDVISIALKVVKSDGKEKRILIHGIIKEGEKYEIKLTKDDLSIGENKIKFETYGDGWIIISDAELELGE